MNYVDAHCHLLDEKEFQNAHTVGMTTVMVNASSLKEWDKIEKLAETQKIIIPNIGIHPWHLEETENDEWLKDLENRLQQNPKLQVGEIGLDKLKPHFAHQKQVFLAQLKLAQKYHRIATIHCVRSWDEMMPLLRPFKKDTKMLFHGFSGDKIVVGYLSNSNSYFSVHSGTRISFIPADKLLIESDAPDGISSPVALPFLYQQLGVDSKTVSDNFERLINGR